MWLRLFLIFSFVLLIVPVQSFSEEGKVTLEQCAKEMNTSVDLLKRLFVIDEAAGNLRKWLEERGIVLSAQTETNARDYHNAELMLKTCFERVKQSFPEKRMILPKVLVTADDNYGDGKVEVEEVLHRNKIVAVSIVIDRNSSAEGCFNTVVTKFLK